MTYNLTDIELQEWARKQREICASEYFINGEPDRYFEDLYHIVKNAPLPPLPISGAKKEDIQPVPPDDEEIIWNDVLEEVFSFNLESSDLISILQSKFTIKRKLEEVEQPVPSIENYGEPERGINIISPTAEQGAEPVASHSSGSDNSSGHYVWSKTKPDFALIGECVLITARYCPNQSYHEYTLYTVEWQEHDEGHYLGLICDDGEEWGDISELESELYMTMPLLKIDPNAQESDTTDAK